jgi:hypothetical protein
VPTLPSAGASNSQYSSVESSGMAIHFTKKKIAKTKSIDVKRHQKIDQAPKSHAKRVNAIIL